MMMIIYDIYVYVTGKPRSIGRPGSAYGKPRSAGEASADLGLPKEFSGKPRPAGLNQANVYFIHVGLAFA